MLQIPCTSQVIRNIALDILTAHDFTLDHCVQIKNGGFFFVLGAHQRGTMSLSSNEVFFSFNRNTKNTTYKSR